MLTLAGVHAGYGPVAVLHGIDLEVRAGEILGLLGRNGAGKTTTIRAIMGLIDRVQGSIRLDGGELVGLPAHRRPGQGVAYVPQGRRLFPDLTVEENLRIGVLAGQGDWSERLAFVLDLFPALADRLGERAGALSGGQQQMVAMGRALAVQPKVLLLDEPTEGLQPSLIERILETIVELRQAGTAMLLVEQKVDAVLAVADRVAFIENGLVREVTDPAALASDPTPLNRYVGLERVDAS